MRGCFYLGRHGCKTDRKRENGKTNLFLFYSFLSLRCSVCGFIGSQNSKKMGELGLKIPVVLTQPAIQDTLKARFISV